MTIYKIIKGTAIGSLILGALILVFYLVELCAHGYINLGRQFSLDTAQKIAPFLGSFIGVFFSIGATLLIFENLRILNVNSKLNDLFTQKAQFETIFFNLISLHNQILSGIDTEIDIVYLEESEKKRINVKGRNFFDDIAANIAFTFERSTSKSLTDLVRIYNYYFDIHNSDMGHYFRNLFHIVLFVDRNTYFDRIRNKNENNLLHKEDYMKILRAQLNNSEIICLSLNGLTDQGENFKPLIESYKLLKNLHFELNLDEDFQKRIVSSQIQILVEKYPHLKKEYEAQLANLQEK